MGGGIGDSPPRQERGVRTMMGVRWMSLFLLLNDTFFFFLFARPVFLLFYLFCFQSAMDSRGPAGRQARRLINMVTGSAKRLPNQISALTKHIPTSWHFTGREAEHEKHDE